MLDTEFRGNRFSRSPVMPAQTDTQTHTQTHRQADKKEFQKCDFRFQRT